jgi:hypothetical protein
MMTTSKKVRHTVSKYLLSSFPLSLSLSLTLSLSLSLSLSAGIGNGDISKESFSEKETAPSPPTDQGFKGCTLRGSATALEHSGSEPFTDQGFDGWPLGGIRQPPQSMQSQG